MVTVALAGATTGFGLTLLHTFIHLNQGKKHKIILLSRSAQPQFAAMGVEVRAVDYTNHSRLVDSLEGVHTLLSLIGGHGIEGAQLALIEACKEAGVARFAPSEYAGSGYDGIDLYKPKAVVWEATKNSGLEYTRFACGLFMSTLATGTPKSVTEVGIREGAKTGEEEALAGLRPWNFVLNIVAGTADLAGDGSGRMVLTDMRDVAHLVWRALELKVWPEELGMRGDVKSYREIIPMLEKVSGRKYLVRENSLQTLENDSANDPSKQFYNQARTAAQTGGLFVGDELNRSFPDMKPITCEEFIEKWWAGVKMGEPAWTENKSFGASEM